VQEDVLGFQIAVDNVILMHEFNCTADLPDPLLHSFLWNGA
jgi:hypothetical protein